VSERPCSAVGFARVHRSCVAVLSKLRMERARRAVLQITRFCRGAAFGRWPPQARLWASSEGRWTALRRPCGRLSGRRQTQNVK
jgi:hypothetical protein